MFSFLPIHAAGYFCDHDKVFHSISEYCVVSYTPTLGGLLSSRQSSPQTSRDETKFLLAAAPKPFTFGSLPAAEEEANVDLGIVEPQHLMKSMSGDISNRFMKSADEVLRLLPRATILHLACHGFQNPNKPLESGFIMEDKIIGLADLIRLNLPHAHLAVLSACETAQGDQERPDEVLHLAASMLFAGFKSIVGTMWSMGDIDGPVVAETIYRELFAGEKDSIDFDIVPYALDAAVNKLRSQGLEPSRWATYVHIGV
jgi:CHAT domain-containing protein